MPVEKSGISITEYMGKVPKVPNQIMGVKEADIPYCANYDRLAEIIHELGQEYKQDNWLKSAQLRLPVTPLPGMTGACNRSLNALFSS